MQIRTYTMLRDVVGRAFDLNIGIYNTQSEFVKVVRAKQLVQFYCSVIHCKSNKILISNSFSCSGSFTAKATLRPLLNFGANDLLFIPPPSCDVTQRCCAEVSFEREAKFLSEGFDFT